MKYIFKILLKVIQWLGKIIRSVCYFIWNFKKRPKQDIDNNSSLRIKENRSNGIVGAISVFVTLLGTLYGVFWGTSSADLYNIEKTISHSFSRMEELEYITGNNTSPIQGPLTQNTKLRGEAKLLSAQMLAQIDYCQNMNLFTLDDAATVKSSGLGMYYEYREFVNHCVDFVIRSKEYLKENNNLQSKSIFYFFSPRLLYQANLLSKVKPVSIEKLDARAKKITNIEPIEKNRAQLEKEIQELFRDGEFIVLTTIMIQYIDLVYECLVEVELSEKYSDYKPKNSNNILLIDQYRP